ncbi:MAG: 4-hydroxy-tetrahydrodipicolinate synthase [Elusimicrobiota bacterium]|nr:4-hydroxy-tetrahydrodipicolinate synthase [Endomicrobiia bacterium]MDW8166231.1 4-hydroxy-tetrahydrodipicolinate synthase [Elusimicrobiota bacterium]
MFQGSIVALVTPFKDGKVDEKKLCELVEWHIQEGTDAILPCGTTGESPTLSYEEHNRVIELVVKQVKKRVPVIGGTGTNSTEESLILSKHAKEVGCDALLLVVPYYNRPTQEGIFLHFKTIAEEINLPVIVYNIPTRTSTNLEPQTFVRLVKECKHIVGIKEASGSIEQVSQIYSLLLQEGLENKVSILSGDDSITYPLMCLGGKGVISVLANILPKKMHEFTQLLLNKNFEEARKIHYELYPLMKAMFIETNPIPVKAAMEIMGLCSAETRLPLTPISSQNKEKLVKILKQYNLI